MQAAGAICGISLLALECTISPSVTQPLRVAHQLQRLAQVFMEVKPVDGVVLVCGMWYDSRSVVVSFCRNLVHPVST